MRILYISDALPYPLVSGDRLRVYNLMRRVATEHELWLAALHDTPDEPVEAAHLRSFCRGVIVATIPRRHPVAHLPGLLRFGLRGIPLELKFTLSPELAAQIRQLTARRAFDLVEIQHSHMAIYLEALAPGTRPRTLLSLHNVTYDQFERIARHERAPLQRLRAVLYSRMMRRWEPRYAARFDRCITVSREERRLLTERNHALRVDLVPNGVDADLLRPLPPAPAPPQLLFIGKMSYAPCADAAIYFCREILPLIRAQAGPVRLAIVGREPPPAVVRLAGDGVVVTGRVDDVAPYYAESAVCIVPLRSGGGTRLKILEAMALGRPVVSTSIGSEGLELADGRDLLVADTPTAFAEATARLLRDGELYRRVAEQARRTVETRYDWDGIAAGLMRIYDEVTEAQPVVGGAR